MRRYYPTSPTQPSEPLWMVLAAPAAAIAAGLLVLLDSAAALSNVASGRGIPALRGGWIGGAALLLVHAGNPSAAWSNPGAAPPRWLFLLTLAVIIGAAAAAGLWVWWWWLRRRDGPRAPGRGKRHGFLSPAQAAARFGAGGARREAARLHPSLSSAELRQRAVAELAVPLGRCGGSPIYASHEHAVAVLAGMRQGKTSGVLARVALATAAPLSIPPANRPTSSSSSGLPRAAPAGPSSSTPTTSPVWAPPPSTR